MREWWGKETTGSNEAAPLAGHLTTGSYDGTDLQKVGFVFLGRMMLIEKVIKGEKSEKAI